MSVLSLCDGLPWILLTADTGSTYDPPANVYTKTPVKLLHHLFLTKMEWLSNAYLASFIQHVSIPIHRRRWHMAKNRMRSVPGEWKRAKSGRRGASCYNLTLDQDLCTEAKTGTFRKAATASLVPQMSPGSRCDLSSVSVWLKLLSFLGITVKSRSSTYI